MLWKRTLGVRRTCNVNTPCFGSLTAFGLRTQRQRKRNQPRRHGLSLLDCPSEATQEVGISDLFKINIYTYILLLLLNYKLQYQLVRDTVTNELGRLWSVMCRRAAGRAMEGGSLVDDGIYICILAHSLNQRYVKGISAFHL